MTSTPDHRAHLEAMHAADQASQGLGIELGETTASSATVTMTVRADMLNGHGNCHGGFLFALADSAFAFASNGCGRITVAAQCQVTFLRPVALGERLVAVATETSRGRATGVYDVTVRRADGKAVALFRGYAMEPGARSGTAGPAGGQG